MCEQKAGQTAAKRILIALNALGDDRDANFCAQEAPLRNHQTSENQTTTHTYTHKYIHISCKLCNPVMPNNSCRVNHK